MSGVLKQSLELSKAVSTPLWLKEQVSEVSRHRATSDTQVVEVFEDKSSGYFYVFLAIERDQFGTKPINAVNIIEPIALQLRNSDHVDPWIFVDRDTFPKTLSHTNPVEKHLPVSPCISLSGNQPLYDQGGLRLILDRLVNWLTDAARGTLNDDGWEPVLFLNQKHIGEIDFKYFQEYGPSNFRASVIDLVPNSYFVNISPTSSDKSFYQAIGQATEVSGTYTLAPEINSSPSPISIKTIADLESLATEFGVRDSLKDHLEKNSKQKSVVIFGVKRPLPLRSNIPGLSQKPNYRSIELLAWLIDSHTDSLSSIRLSSKVTPNLLTDTSNLNARPQNCTIIGCGSLGSYLAQMFAQSGSVNMNLIDYDLFMPHNSARHVLGRFWSGSFKADGLKYILELNTATKIQATPKDFCSLNDLSFKSAVKGSSLIVDASANTNVRQNLCSRNISQRVSRVELADQGNLGFLLLESNDRSVRLDDLWLYAHNLGCENDIVSKWLCKNDLEYSIDTGLGCASASVKVGGSIVQAHASAFFNALQLYKDNSSAGIGINVLENGLPKEWYWFFVPPVKIIKAPVFSKNDSPKWEVRVLDSAYDEIKNELSNASPQETGGFLYGNVDTSKQIIYVAKAIVGDVIASSAVSLSLGRAGKSTREIKFQNSTGKQLSIIGSWHTHPNGSSNLSLTDKSTASAISNDCIGPFLLLVASKKDLQGTIIYPQAW